MRIKGKEIKKRFSRSKGPIRKKFCRFCRDKVETIDYKDLNTLEKFVTDRGKILSSRISGNCAKHQRRITAAIKKARFLALLTHVKT